MMASLRSAGLPEIPSTPISLVTVGVIAYNEAERLSDVLGDIVAQDFPHERIEVFLVDSASTDNTRQIMEAFAADNGANGHGFADVRVFDNPKRIIPAGWNVAFSNFTGDAFIRVDGHARIPEDFVRSAVEVLEEGEYVCGGPRPVIATPETPWTKTLLVAEQSAFGSSVASYRNSTENQYVSAVFLPTFRREVIEAVGLYDERLLRTEDNDYCYRIREAGFKIRFDMRIHSVQVARSSFARMMKQKFGNGFWVGKTVWFQPKCLHLHHFAPFAFVLGIIVMLIIGFVISWIPFAVCAALYIAICVVLAARAAKDSEDKTIKFAALPVVFFCIHFCYGIGTISGLLSGRR